MNKITQLFAFMLMAALLAVSASAQLTASNVQFGDETQERNQNVTKTITLTNPTTSDVALTGLNFNGLNGADVTQYRFVVTAVTYRSGLTVVNGVLSGTLAAGISATVTLQAFVPKNFNAIDSELASTAFEIATLSASPSTVTLTGGRVSMQAKNKLVVQDMNIAVNGESQSVSNNEKVDNVKPGDKLELEVIAKNQYSDRSDVDIAIDDVLVTVRSNNLDQLDVDDEEDIGTLSAKSEDSGKFAFTVEDSTDDSTYTMTIKVSGVDENGAKHGEKQTLRVKVERETHEIAFKKVQVVPGTIECESSRTANVDVTVNNIGQRDEDSVVVEASVPQLKFSRKITGLKLNDGKSKTVQFPLEVPESAKPGVYRVDLTTYYENVVKSNMKSVSFDVDSCEVEEEEEVEDEPVVVAPQVTTTPPQTTPPATTTAPKARISTQSFTDSPLYVYALAGMSGFMLLLLIVLVFVLAGRRHRRDEDDDD